MRLVLRAHEAQKQCSKPSSYLLRRESGVLGRAEDLKGRAGGLRRQGMPAPFAPGVRAVRWVCDSQWMQVLRQWFQRRKARFDRAEMLPLTSCNVLWKVSKRQNLPPEAAARAAWAAACRPVCRVPESRIRHLRPFSSTNSSTSVRLSSGHIALANGLNR